MHKKTADELNAIQSQFFPLAAAFVILYLYGYCVFVHAQDTAVADRYPVCVTPKVMHHGFRSGKRLPDIRDSVFPIADIQQFLVFMLVAVFGGCSLITKIPRLMQHLEPGQKFPLEKCGHCLSGQEETSLFLMPVPVCVKPSACTEYMDIM